MNHYINKLNELVFKMNNLKLHRVLKEVYNEAYQAHTLYLDDKSIRYRKSKITPTKSGQFVSFWTKDENGKNRAYTDEESKDFLLIDCMSHNSHEGFFLFPKDALLKHDILKTMTEKGKMGMRVYPSWESVDNKTAFKTQCWQTEYFVDLSLEDDIVSKKVLMILKKTHSNTEI